MRLRIGICSGFEQGLKAVKFAQSASEVHVVSEVILRIVKFAPKGTQVNYSYETIVSKANNFTTSFVSNFAA